MLPPNWTTHQGEICMQRLRVVTLTVSLGLVLMVVCSTALAPSGYQRMNLVSNLAGKALHTDPLLANPWGLAYSPGAPFWVSDEASGWSTLYDAKGNPQSLQVVIPPASGTGKGTPTGIVYNGSPECKIRTLPSAFFFPPLNRPPPPCPPLRPPLHL